MLDAFESLLLTHSIIQGFLFILLANILTNSLMHFFTL